MSAKDTFEKGMQPHEFPEPDPLMRELPPAKPFPVDALMALQPAAEAIHDYVQSPMALGAQSLLATTALATQQFYDVVMPYGLEQTKPTSLYFITIAPSGERKTSSDAHAFYPARIHEDELRRDHESELRHYNLDKSKYEQQRKAAKDHAALDQLGDAPKKPPIPQMVVDDPTWPAICLLFEKGRKSLGLFAPEGGTFLGGPGMHANDKLLTITGFSKVFDGDPIRRARRGDDDITVMTDRRLSMHLMVQPHIAMGFYSDPVIRGQGLLSRLLFTFPESTMGTRPLIGHTPKESSTIALANYYDIIKGLLEHGDKQVGDRKTIRLTADSDDVARSFRDHVARCSEMMSPG